MSTLQRAKSDYEKVMRVRSMQQGDRNFILNSWLKSFRNAPSVNGMENPAYFHEQSKVITELLDNCAVLMAVDPKDNDSIFGYLVYQWADGQFVIHYVYTKHTFRNKGVAQYLIHKAGFALGETAAWYTHATKTSPRVAYKFRCIYNPFITRYFKTYLER